jgi:phage shock protein E
MFSRFKNLRSTETLSPLECRERFAEGATMLDVRTPEEYAKGHLACAINVDVLATDFTGQVESLGLDPSRPVYLYCLSGNRSGQAAKMLRREGFEQAFNVGSYRALLKVGFENG